MIRFSIKLKVALGYILLLLLLILSVVYINKKVAVITSTDDSEIVQRQRRKLTNDIVGQLYEAEIIGQSLSAGDIRQYGKYIRSMNMAAELVDSLRLFYSDSLQLMRLDSVEVLLINKKRNMNSLLQTIANDTVDIYRKHVDGLIAEQNPVLTIPHVHRKIVTHTNSYIVPKKTRGFFRRLSDVFFPGKGDSTKYEKVIKEESVDSINSEYSPSDTIMSILDSIKSKVAYSKQINDEKKDRSILLLRQNGIILGSQVNKLLKTIEYEESVLSYKKRVQNEKLRSQSASTVAYIAIVAIFLAIVFLIFIWRDISRSSHYRKELEKAKKKAEELLVAREQLMLTITHDIKAPTSSVIGYTNLMERIVTDERQKVYLGNMRESARHLLHLVNSLLDFYRLDSNKMDINPVTFNPNQLFDSIIVSFRPIARKKNINLDFIPDESLDEIVIADAFRIRQIVDNLISNAIKFTKNGEVLLCGKLYDDKLHIVVKDTGCGMRPDDKERIFREFTRLKDAQGEEGFGLGLAITGKLVNLLGGNISVESDYGKGSAFEVYIPIKHEIEYEKLPETDIRVIIIDDDRLQLQLTRDMLDKENVEVACCESPEELFDRLEKEKFDVILTDIQMPAIDGFSLLSKVRASSFVNAQDIPVIAVTARSDMDEASLIDKGFACCIHKPFTQKELLDKIFFNCKDTEEGAGRIGQDEDKEQELDISALTAFSCDDAEASREILTTFISETDKNILLLESALHDRNAKDIAKIAHKICPVYSMIHANDCVCSLRQLESMDCTVGLTDETAAMVGSVIKDMRRIEALTKKLL